jgi:hypothetical protein
MSFTPRAAGTYCFLAVYSGNTNYLGSSDAGANECFVANPAPAVLGSTVRIDDTASMQKNSVAGTPSGSMAFTLYGPFSAAPTAAACSSATAPVAATETVPAGSEKFDSSGTGYWTADVDVPATGGTNVWYAWGSSFTPANSNYAAGALACTSEMVNVQYAASNPNGGSNGFSLPNPPFADSTP